MRGLKNVKVYVEGQGVIETSIGFEKGRIAAIGSDLEVEELGGSFLSQFQRRKCLTSYARR